MRYPYECPKCGDQFDIYKSVVYIDNEESCPKCNCVCTAENRIILPGAIFFGADDWNKQEWCPGLGCYVKGNKHRKQIAKERGLEEVGNEDPRKILAADEKRQEELAERNYDKMIKDELRWPT